MTTLHATLATGQVRPTPSATVVPITRAFASEPVDLATYSCGFEGHGQPFSQDHIATYARLL